MTNSERIKIADDLIQNFYEEHKNEGYVILENVPTKELEVGDIVAIIVACYDDIPPYLMEIDLIVLGKEWAVINDSWAYEYDRPNKVLRKM